jgi:hypothetical protein
LVIKRENRTDHAWHARMRASEALSRSIAAVRAAPKRMSRRAPRASDALVLLIRAGATSVTREFAIAGVMARQRALVRAIAADVRLVVVHVMADDGTTLVARGKCGAARMRRLHGLCVLVSDLLSGAAIANVRIGPVRNGPALEEGVLGAGVEIVPSPCRYGAALHAAFGARIARQHAAAMPYTGQAAHGRYTYFNVPSAKSNANRAAAIALRAARSVLGAGIVPMVIQVASNGDLFRISASREAHYAAREVTAAIRALTVPATLGVDAARAKRLFDSLFVSEDGAGTQRCFVLARTVGGEMHGAACAVDRRGPNPRVVVCDSHVPAQTLDDMPLGPMQLAAAVCGFEWLHVASDLDQTDEPSCLTFALAKVLACACHGWDARRVAPARRRYCEAVAALLMLDALAKVR